MKTLYQADDGVLFDSYEECAEYEHSQIETPILKEINSNMVFFDCEGNILDWGTAAAHSLERCFHRCTYVRVYDDVSGEAIQWVDDELGIHLPQYHGLYRYCDDIDDWEDYRDECNEYNRKWSAVTGIALHE